MARVFLVEDNESIREAVAGYLRLDDHDVLEFQGVSGVAEEVKQQMPDILILDVMLPDGDGFSLAKRLRSEHPVPIIFLTARERESDRITGFELGADDYVVKPFSPKELALRVNAVLKRSLGPKQTEKPGPGSWIHGEERISIDTAAHRIVVNGEERTLTAAEWKILEYLAENAGILLEREKILGECLGYLYEGSQRTVDTHIKNLRAKLGSPDWIETVRAYGYRFTGKRI